MLLNDNHVRGIFKYSPDVFFEKDDFVVDGNCIYICISGDPVIGKKPSEDSEHIYYSEYPGDKIVNASEYYDYVRSTERGEQVEDKYVSAHSLCEILEDMYFGFGDNGIVYDHVIYNPNTGIEYSVRGVCEILDYSTPNVLDMILRDNNLNNGLIKVSRSLPEIRDLVMDSTASSNDVILKQYTYLDSVNFIPYRVQELLDPEKNRLYFRFSKGQRTEENISDFSNVIVSSWKNLYTNNQDALEKLNSLENYYQERIHEEEAKVARISGKYCYREVDSTESNHLGENVVFLRPGETRDIKSMDSFSTYPCLLNVLVKVQADSGIFRNYSAVIDAKDAYDSLNFSEIYNLGDGITLTSVFDIQDGIQRLTLSVSSGFIKNIYYRDYTLGHIHDWVERELQAATCLTSGSSEYTCSSCHEIKIEDTPPLGHNWIEVKNYQASNCVDYGWHEYWKCSRCNMYFHDGDRYTTNSYSGWDSGNDPVKISATGHHEYPDNWTLVTEADCTHDGLRAKYCIHCGHAITETIPATEHDIHFVVGLETVTRCGNYGIRDHYHCNNCNKDFQDPNGDIEATNDYLIIYPTGAHDLSAYDTDEHSHNAPPIIVQESTYTDYPSVESPKPEHGIGMKVCALCGNSIQVSLPFKKYVFSQDQEIINGAAFATERGLHYPSYTEGYYDGEYRRNYNWRDDVSIDRQLDNHTVDATQHSNYTNPTCTEYGYWTGTCILCGESNVRQYNWDARPTGHTIPPSNVEYWSQNTCTEPAHFIGRCSECGQDHADMVDPNHLEIGHVNHNGICEVCHMNLE